jgi:hypothetical protein
MEGAIFYYKLVHKAQIKEIEVKMLGSVDSKFKIILVHLTEVESRYF